MISLHKGHIKEIYVCSSSCFERRLLVAKIKHLLGGLAFPNTLDLNQLNRFFKSQSFNANAAGVAGTCS